MIDLVNNTDYDCFRVRDADKEIVFLKDKERTDASQLNILTDDNANLQSRYRNMFALLFI